MTSAYTWMYLLLGLAFVGLAGLSAFRRRPTVEAARDDFMRETGAYLDPSFLAAFDARRRRSHRHHVWSLLILGVLLLLLSGHTEFTPVVVIAPAYVLMTLPGSVERLRGAGQDFVVPGSQGAVARPRHVVLADYVPVRSQLLTWGSAAIVAVIGVGTFAHRHETGRAAAIILVGSAAILGGAVFTAWFGRALCVRPTPAVDASHLYLQDAWRAQALEQIHVENRLNAVLFTTTALGVSINPLAFPLSIYLMLCAAAVVFGSLLLPKQHFRRRLWPTLEPGQVLLPGEPVPPRQVGATA